MDFKRADDGSWSVTSDPDGRSSPDYLEKLRRYLTALDPIFSRARAECESEFILTLLRVRGLSDAGWDPYETTLEAVPMMIEVMENLDSAIAQRHLSLWIYLHIIEASEPYEILANLLGVIAGERFHISRFPPRGKKPQSPGEKIAKLEAMADPLGLTNALVPLKEAWNRGLRNAIGHSDYTVHGPELRTIRPTGSYSRDELFSQIASGVAYQAALSTLYEYHVAAYTEPKLVRLHPGWGLPEAARGLVVVRENYGVTGLKQAMSREQVARGGIQFSLAKGTREELDALSADPELAFLPARSEENSEG